MELNLRTTFYRMQLLSANMRKKERVRRNPTGLTVETTTECNLKCATCHRTRREPPPLLMPVELFQKILEDCAGTVELINLFGMGEPLLDPYLVERVRRCDRLGIKTHVATNGTLIDDENAQALMDAGLTAVTFSMNSVRPDVYERLHKGADYADTVRRVEKFLRWKKERRSPVHVTIEMIRTPLTAKECTALRHRWRTVEGVDAVRIRHDEFGGFGEFAEENGQWAEAPGVCHHLWQGPLLIRADGGMYPCCVSALDHGALANVKDMTPREFWTSEAMSRLRRRHIDRRIDERLPCASCRAPKPVPLLGHISYFASAWGARRIAVYLERLSLAYHWKVQRREID